MKKPLPERMAAVVIAKGFPKSWIAEVKALLRTIGEKDQKLEEYGQLIDVLAREKEKLEELNIE